MTLSGKRIVVGVGGGIAAFKAVTLVRELMRRGAEVRVAMTQSGARFVGPVTFTGITGQPAATDLWDPSFAGEMHVELSNWADVVVVAPATANLLARAAQGLADDVVLATLLCSSVPVLYAPAMHTRMWRNPATQRSVEQLVRDGAKFEGPAEGALANGEEGEGRMREPEEIADAVENMLRQEDLGGFRLLVSAGPTVEDVDPVRFLSNRSSGRMGYAIADRAARRGAHVTLVSGPVSLTASKDVELIEVRSALEMHAAISERAADADAVIMAAAVADYRPRTAEAEKIKKGDEPMTLVLVRNPDILKELGEARNGTRPLLVGFALESSDLEAQGRAKLVSKGADLVVANLADTAFAGEENEAMIISATGTDPLPRMPKAALADRLLDRVRDLLTA